MARLDLEEVWERTRQDRRDRNKPLEECLYCCGTGFTHSRDCPGESAWDIPEACKCHRPKCRICRGKKFVPPEVNDKHRG